jgi:predicted metal-dependent phosphoesterase TrpH
VTYQNQAAGFREQLPYVFAIVELAEGVRVVDQRRRLRAGRGAHRHARRGGLRRRDAGDHAAEVPAGAMILDLHLHSELSDDSRAPVEAYLKLLARKRDERPLDGIVLTGAPAVRPGRDYRALEDAYGFRILTAAEVETDYGHVLVYGVNADILGSLRLHRRTACRRRSSSARWRASAGIALPCHPAGRTSASAPTTRRSRRSRAWSPVEALNGGSRKGEDDRVQALITRHGYAAFGGSDSHLVSFVGLCATEFEADIRTRRGPRPGAREPALSARRLPAEARDELREERRTCMIAGSSAGGRVEGRSP